MLESLIKKYLTTPIALKYVGSVVRHALTFVAGVLVSYGVVKDGGADWIATNQDVIMGLVAYALAQGFSFAEKKKDQK
jgi:hypothetical protein